MVILALNLNTVSFYSYQADTRAIQQLNAQLREKDDRLRQREEEFQTQLQQKDEQGNADISRLQREIQRLQVSVYVITSIKKK